jgi:hypothetical protein
VKKVRTEHFIPFPPERAWAVLTDFGAYADWNPLNIEAAGDAGLGNRIAMTFVNPARPGTTIDQIVRISVFEPFRRLAWRGRVPLLFHGCHHFELIPEAGGTRLLHGEDMSGLVALAFSAARIERDFVPVYERTNRALEARVAALSGAGK